MPQAPDRDRLRVVLVRTRNPLNIGAVARVMSNFGFLRLRLVQPFEPSFREARSAVGAEALLQAAEVFDDLGAAVSDCTIVAGTSAVRNREIHQRLQLLAEGAATIRGALKSERVAVVFGSEKTGLSAEELSHCNLLLTIPTRDEHLSLNLAQAVAISLYEISRSEIQAGSPPRSELRATSGEVDRISQALMQALQGSGYVKGDSEDAIELKVRRLVKRMSLSDGDAELLLGMLRKIVWSLNRE